MLGYTVIPAGFQPNPAQLDFAYLDKIRSFQAKFGQSRQIRPKVRPILRLNPNVQVSTDIRTKLVEKDFPGKSNIFSANTGILTL
jgi:hypothetical protein